MDTSVKEIVCKTALHCHDSKWLPYRYDINVYRGCAHRCVYCYALYSHEYLGGGDFYREIYAKTNIADVLRRELPAFSRETVNLGGITDSYQPAEREYKLMPGVLSLLARYSVPVTLSTKSTLILRDVALLKKIDEASAAKAAFTVTTMDKTVARLIEPNAPTPRERMNALGEIKKQGLTCGVHMMPVLPYLTSGEASLEAVFSAAKDAGADYILAGALNLRGGTRQGFFESIRQSFPAEYGRIKEIYHNKEAYKAYKRDLDAVLIRLRKKYTLPYYSKIPEKPEPKQLSFLSPL
ncbi:MAG: radical SAM protein [Eubacteriales bacterium]|nr:radical SAM protein [Eubacteriales bacterium]